jgi:hypothetical protein
MKRDELAERGYVYVSTITETKETLRRGREWIVYDYEKEDITSRYWL